MTGSSEQVLMEVIELVEKEKSEDKLRKGRHIIIEKFIAIFCFVPSFIFRRFNPIWITRKFKSGVGNV